MMELKRLESKKPRRDYIIIAIRRLILTKPRRGDNIIASCIQKPRRSDIINYN